MMTWLHKAARRTLLAAALVCAALADAGAGADDLEAMRRAAHHLAKAQLPSGLLTFDIDLLAGQGYAAGDSAVEGMAYVTREAGAAYGLAKYLAWSKDESVKAPLERLIASLGALSLPVSKSPTQRWLESLHVLSLPIGRHKLHALLERRGWLYQPTGSGLLVSYGGSYESAWAGATALALTAELEYFRATGDARFAPLRAAWLEGLGVLYAPGLGIREFPGSIEEAAYANGESWLALATYAALFPKDAARGAVLLGFEAYLMEKYAALPDRQFYAWGMMAAGERFAATKDVKFAAFIAAQTRHFVDQEFPAAQRSGNSCAFVEGLAAARNALRERPDAVPLMAPLQNRIEREMVKNRALQIPPGVTELTYPGGSFRSDRLADFAGAYLTGGAELYARVDMTAHCLSALIEVQR